MNAPTPRRRPRPVRVVSLLLLAAAVLIASQTSAVHPLAAVAWLLAFAALLAALTLTVRSLRPDPR